MNEFRIHKLFADLLSGGHFCTYSHPKGSAKLQHLNLRNQPVVLVDGKKLEVLEEHAKLIDPEKEESYHLLFKRLEQAVLGSGSGPIAPCFDDIDYDNEAKRGKWYVFYQQDWEELVEIFKAK